MDEYHKLKKQQKETNAKIVTCAAVFIQKIWRGHLTRRKLHEQLR